MAILEFNHWGSAIWGEASMCCSHLHLHIHHHNSQEIFWFRIVCTSQCMLQAAHSLHLSCNKHVHFSMRVPKRERRSEWLHARPRWRGQKKQKNLFWTLSTRSQACSFFHCGFCMSLHSLHCCFFNIKRPFAFGILIGKIGGGFILWIHHSIDFSLWHWSTSRPFTLLKISINSSLGSLHWFIKKMCWRWLVTILS